MFTVNNKDTRHPSGVFIVNFEHASYLVLGFLLLILNMLLPDGITLFRCTVMKEHKKFF